MYARCLILTDVLAVVVGIFGAQIIRFGAGADRSLLLNPTDDIQERISYTVFSCVLILAWLAALSVFGTRSAKLFGGGAAEYKTVVNATLSTFGLVAVLAFSLRTQIGRGYVFVALPVGLLLLLVGRYAWRQFLRRRREGGEHLYRTLVMGERAKSHHLVQQLRRRNMSGFHVVGAVTERGSGTSLAPDIPVVASYDSIVEMIDRLEIDTLIVTAADSVTPQRLKEIGWELETRNVDLVVAASLTDIAGPRIHFRPVLDLPLIHVEFPEFAGRKYLTKRLFDIVSSLTLLLLLSPVLLAIAALVKTTSVGPVLFTQERVGVGGGSFNMLKFRSMVIDAEDRLDDLRGSNDGSGVLFKMKDDPRVTGIGRVIRKYSLDELPQLVNVLRGDMSLVGPRPPLRNEVESYETWVHRRLLVKPGVTGLWQVSGRSNLSWEDSVRLDLYYVENWSMTGDVMILLRTVKTVVTPEGAY